MKNKSNTLALLVIILGCLLICFADSGCKQVAEKVNPVHHDTIAPEHIVLYSTSIGKYKIASLVSIDVFGKIIIDTEDLAVDHGPYTEGQILLASNEALEKAQYFFDTKQEAIDASWRHWASILEDRKKPKNTITPPSVNDFKPSK